MTAAAVTEVSPVHAEELASSCIGADHIAARGYRTLYGSDDDRAELKTLRIPRFMWRHDTAFPGLLIPEYRVTGELIGYQWKPAVPQRNSDGKPVKYASQSGTPNHLDIPPLVSDKVRDPSNPLWITEGVKKADCLATLEKAVITLTGVYNWRSKLGTLGDWEDIPIQGRTVVVCFDSDARSKRPVMLAMRRLGLWLQSKGAAEVRYLIVPSEVPQGEDRAAVEVKGVDDYFHAGGTLEDLGGHAARELPVDGARDAAFSDAVLADTVCSEELEGQYKWSSGLGWMVWTGKFWKSAEDVTVTEAVRLWVLSQFHRVIDLQGADPNRDMRSQIDGWRSALAASKLSSLVKLSRGILECDASDFDSDADVLNCPNGILDLRTGVLTTHDPDRLMTKMAGVDYVKGAQHPDWDTALTALPADVLEWFQLRIGQALTGHLTPDDLAVICQGGGENGKSTVFNALTTAAGKYHITVADRAMLGNASDNHPTEMTDFLGARFAILEETPESRRLDTNRLKKLVGTREITARKIRQNDITFTTTHSLFVNTNFRPVVDETDHGTWRRLALLIFPYTYRKTPAEVLGPQDRLGDGALRQRIETQPVMEAALAWAVQGAQRWYDMERIMPDMPDRVRGDTLGWRKESDPVMTFVDEEIVFDPDAFIIGSELRSVFNHKITEKGGREWGDKTFSARFGGHDLVVQHGVEYKVTKNGTGLSTRLRNPSSASTVRAWRGVRFSDPDAETGGGAENDPFGKSPVGGGNQDQVTAVTSAPISTNPGSRIEVNRQRVTAVTDLEITLPSDQGNEEELENSIMLPDDPFGEAEDPPAAVWEGPLPDRVTFDLETASADEMFTYGDGFVRLAGFAADDGEPRTGVDIGQLVWLLERVPSASHNGMQFDGPALAYHHGMDWEKFSALAEDTEIKARLADPPRSKETGGSDDKYDLDHTAEKLGVRGKTDSAKRLKNKFGGWDRIPQDDPEYHAYLSGDVEAGRAVDRLLPVTEYGRREHRLAGLAGRMTLNGCRVDVPLLKERIREGQEKKASALEALSGTYSLPLGREVMRGRGKAKAPAWEPFSSPLATTEGGAWLADLWKQFGVVRPPRTPNGNLSTAAERLKEVAENRHCPPELKTALELMGIVTTTRTVYQTVEKYLTVEGRVHPTVSMRQASGRWSVTKPGLTVFGKRDGRHIERDVIVPEEGHLLVTCDLAQVDMRAVAAHCQDENYMQLFEPGRDAHAEIAALIGVSRQDAKPLGHGYNYGMGRARMKRDGHDPELVDAFFDGMESQFPVKMAWTKDVIARGTAGELLDNGFGRMMRCDPRSAYTVAPALMGQGGARDITCEVLLRLIDRHPEYQPYLRAYVHDEFVFSVPEDRAEEIGAEIKDAFTWEWKGVPILADLSGPGPSWGAVSAK